MRGRLPRRGDGALRDASVSISGRYDRTSFQVIVGTRFMGMTLRQERRGRHVRDLQPGRESIRQVSTWWNMKGRSSAVARPHVHAKHPSAYPPASGSAAIMRSAAAFAIGPRGGREKRGCRAGNTKIDKGFDDLR